MRFNSQIGVAAGVAAMSIAVNACAQTAVEWREVDGGNGHWYQLVQRPYAEYNWNETHALSLAVGGDLASFETVAEWSFVRAICRATPPNPYGQYLSGGRRSVGGSSQWNWLTGTQFSYFAWNPGVPNNGTAEDLVLCVTGGLANPTAVDGWDDWRVVDLSDGYIIEYSADCNNDGIVDYGQILAGDLSDANANNIPDCCEAVFVCWGDNSNQQCTPPKGAFAPIGIASGYNHSVALLADGTVVGWGSNVSGQCDVPTSVFAPRQIAAGDSHSMALIADGSVRCWGRTVEGQCTIPSAAQNVVLISAGGNHSLAVVADRTLLAWGWNNYGQSTVPASLTSVALVEAGVYHTAVVTTSGSVVCFGLDDYGQCTPPSFPSTPIAVSAGDRHTAALLPDGTIRCWGQNSFGQCSPPKSLPLLTAIATSDRYTMGLSSSGEVFQWGSVPAAVPAGIGEVTVIAAGAYHVVAAVSAPPCPRAACAGDIVIDGAVNGIDLAAVLSLWGTSGGALDADVNNDGAVDAQDLAIVLSAWGACE